MPFPRRTRTHVLETESRNNLSENIPDEWVIQNLDNDYGIDNIIEIAQQEELIGDFFSIQLKGTDQNFQNQEIVRVRMNTATINYLMNRVELVMIVLYVSNENESYWIWLRDAIGNINYENQTYTISIPKTNRFSDLNWERIVEFVNQIRNQKIEAARNINFNYETE